MKVLKNYENKVIVDVNINGNKAGEYKIRTDDHVNGTATKIAAYINSRCGSDETKNIVREIQSNLAIEVIKQLIWEKGTIKQILSDAFELAPTKEIEESIISMQIKLLPLLNNIYDPRINKMSKSSSRKFCGLQTYDQVLTVIFAKNFLNDGIITFNARLEK